MRIINAMEHSVLDIGYQGENERTRVVFDLSDLIEEFGTGTAVLLVSRPTDTEASPVLIAWDEETVYWDVTESDLAYKGEGECQLVFTPEGSTIAKTHIWETSIDRALSESENPPEPWSGWVDQILTAAAEVEQTARDIPQIIDDALAEAKASGEFDGTGISRIVFNSDYTLTIYLTDGTDYTTGNIRGAKGDTGNGIASIVLNQDYTLTINFTDGTSTTTTSIRGEKGDTGVGIANITLNQDYTLTITLTDGTEYTTASIRGEKGDKGDTGVSISGVVLNQDYTLTINFSNGTSTTTTSIRGEKGETGATPDISIGTVETLAPGSQATATMTGTPENPVLNLGIPQGQKGDQGVPGEVTEAELQTKAPVIIGSAEGGIATLLDGANGMPIKSLIAEFLPNQSGTGDPSPTNKRPFVPYTDLKIYRSGKNLLQNNLESGSAYGITWTVNEDGSIALSGTAESDPRTPGFMVIVINSSATADRQVIGYGSVKLGCNGRASYNPLSLSPDLIFQNDIYVDNTYKGTIQTNSPTRAISGGIVAIGTSRLKINEGTVIPDGTVYYPMIEIIDNVSNYTPSAYEKCVKDDYTVQFTNANGDVYGGRLDLEACKAIVEWGLVTLPSSFSVFNSGTGTGKYTVFSVSSRVAYDLNRVDVYAEAGKGVARANRGNAWEFFSTDSAGLGVFVPSDSTPESVAEAIGGTTAVVRLETPLEFDIDPVEILTLFGVNNVWTGAGNVSIEAPLDTKSYIDRLTKSDTDMTADNNIASGQYFSINNRLYIATSAIAAGTTVVPGTSGNCLETSIAEALNALNT